MPQEAHTADEGADGGPGGAAKTGGGEDWGCETETTKATDPLRFPAVIHQK